MITTKPSIDALFAELDAARGDLDAIDAVFERIDFFCPAEMEEGGEIDQRLQARLDRDGDRVRAAEARFDRARDELARKKLLVLSAWAEVERAKGRPEAELTWDNCVAELNLVVPDIDEAVAKALRDFEADEQ